ncbi:EpsG family protein [Manganibacter manganicus]|uniref:EpsG family protein n=1 Tax=Manganibacter manganicus TaxID=1873176 RepID=A0A1V8RWP6_9HYPH|nr:EpsG family protein [Pseudaminobacter manganicus]OQM77583.1 hypothetical protein BFN67_01740 [Pseudaminobacter manganicus]
MLPYWILFAVPALAALQEQPRRLGRIQHSSRYLGFTLLVTGMIGFRYQVGTDWGAYIRFLDIAHYFPFSVVMARSDPGYMLLNWFVARTFYEIWIVNIACGLIFAWGLVAFVRIQPRPWLALLVAVPYLIIVVAMNYSRQSVAIGLTLLGLVALTRDQSNMKFVFWIALAATFHKTAVVLVPLAALASRRGRLWTAAWVGVATILFYYLFLEDSLDRLVTNYVKADLDSQGAMIRTAMNALPAAIFLFCRWRFPLRESERRLWTNMAWAALGMVGLLAISSSSTVVDRLGLYLIPLQIFVLARLPDAFPSAGKGINVITLGVVLYSAAIQFVWLNFASHAVDWLPYQLYPLLS